MTKHRASSPAINNTKPKTRGRHRVVGRGAGAKEEDRSREKSFLQIGEKKRVLAKSG